MRTVDDYAYLGAGGFQAQIESAKHTANGLLSSLFDDLRAVSLLEERLAAIFGRANAEAIASFLTDFAPEDWPEIRILPAESLPEGWAAYHADENLILLSVAALEMDAREPGILAHLLIEELGHYIDDRFNALDTPGDEGAAFVSLVKTGGGLLFDFSGSEGLGLALIDGDWVTVEQASIFDSGGYEGSQRTISLEGTGNNVLSYSFEFYGIPDRFIVRYEGKTLVDTGFTSGSRSGEVKIERGQADFAQIFVVTDNTGTAWNYSVQTKGNELPDTSPFIVQPVGGDFTDPDGDGVYEYTGTVVIGRKDGNSSLLRVENGTVSISDKVMTVSNATVYAATGGVSQALFSGSFTIPYATGVAGGLALADNGRFLPLAGLDATLEGFVIRRDAVLFNTDFFMPGDLGAIRINKTAINSDILRLDSGGLRFAGPDFKLNLPDLEYKKLLGLFDVEATKTSIGYQAFQDEIRFQSEVSLAAPIKGVPTKLTANFAGDNYIRVKDGDVDFKGSLKLATEIALGRFKFKEFQFDIDTTGTPTTVGAQGKFELPMGARTPEIKPSIEFALDPFTVNKIGLDIDNMNVPVPFKPDFFFQRLKFGFDNVAPHVTAPFTVEAGLGFTYGPQFDLGKIGPFDFGRVAVSRGDLDAEFTANSFKGTGTVSVLSPNILRETGTIELNWQTGNLGVSGGYEFLFGSARGNANLKVDTNYNTSLFGSAAVSVPNIAGIPKIIKGKELAGGNAGLAFTNDGNFGNDWAAVWGTILIDLPYGQVVDMVVGIKARFDGSFGLIGANSIPTPSTMRVASFDGDAGFATMFRTTADAEVPYVLLVLEWENDDVHADDIGDGLVVTTPDGVEIAYADFAANNIVIVEGLSGDGHVTVAVGPAAGETGVPRQGWGLRAADDAGLVDVFFEAYEPAAEAAVEILDVGLDGGTGIEFRVDADTAFGDVTLYYDDDNEGYDGIPIASGLSFISGEIQSYTWDTSTLPPGSYYVYAAVAPEGGIPTVSEYSVNQITVSGGADIKVETDLIDREIPAGQGSGSVTYNVTVSNDGVEIARDVTFTEFFTSGAYYYYQTNLGTWGSLSSTDSSFSVGLGDLAPGEEKNIAVTVSRLSSAAQEVLHQSAVYSKSYDTDVENNIADGNVTFSSAAQLQGIADLSISLEAAALDGDVGSLASYTLRVTNNGPDEARDVWLREYVEGLTAGGYNLAAYTVDGGFVRYLSATNPVISLSNIESGESRLIEFTGTIQTSGTTISSSELYANGSFDPDLENNSLVTYRSADAVDVLDQHADISLSGSISSTAIRDGDEITFTVTVNNAGPNPATGVQVKIDLSAGIEVLSASGIQGSYDQATGIWDVGNMRESLARSFTFNVRVNEATAAFAAAQLFSVVEPDPNSTPNNGYVGEDDEIIFFGTPPRGDSGGGGPRPTPNPDGIVIEAPNPFEDAVLEGTDGNDVMTGGFGNDTFIVKRGNDSVFGGEGFDRVVFDFEFEQAVITIQNGLPVSVMSPRGTYTLDSIEMLEFTNGNLAFLTGSEFGAIMRLYQASFDRAPDTDGYIYWYNAQKAGESLFDIAAKFADSAEFRETYRDLTTEQLVEALYRNILDRDAEQEGLEFWVDALTSGTFTLPGVLIGFSESPENIENTASPGGIWLL